jgi:hypothetical protein
MGYRKFRHYTYLNISSNDVPRYFETQLTGRGLPTSKSLFEGQKISEKTFGFWNVQWKINHELSPLVQEVSDL